METFTVFGYGSLIFKPPPHVITQTPGFLKGYVRRFAQKSHDHRGTPENPGRVVTLIHKEDWDLFSSSDPFPNDDTVWGEPDLSVRLDGLLLSLLLVQGIAYTIDPVYVAEVRDYLDYREKDGYTMETLDVYSIENGQEKVAIHNVPITCVDSSLKELLMLAVLRRKKRQSILHWLRATGRTVDDDMEVGGAFRSQQGGHLNLDTTSTHFHHSLFAKEYLYRLADAVRGLSPDSYDSHLYALEKRVKELDENNDNKE
ncbi:hypothetical protein EYR36_011959 [Pleurotus pulmonarius]|nr:hypothetical protein EYR36_011959 [Pleurotus pulmonarius]